MPLQKPTGSIVFQVDQGALLEPLVLNQTCRRSRIKEFPHVNLD